MNRHRIRKPGKVVKVRNTGLFALLLSLLLLSPVAVFATDLDISRLAHQLNLLSGQLAQDLEYRRGYSSVHQHANRLSREAALLVDAVRRNRSHSYLRSQFNDVSRRYTTLEKAFLRANRGDHNPQLYNDVSLISTLFSDLSTEFYYSSYGDPQPYYSATPFIIYRR